MTPGRITTIAINAMGGHGGGVLANWIAETAEREGHFAQVTSVPGFAQRSGATIYYVELFPKAQSEASPVFALMAVPGDVDIVIASELAEAGRAVLRGIVTPDRTTLIASSHREYTTDEKLSRFDGRRDSSVVFDRCERAARKFIAFDMREAASQSGCLLSAILFGSLAGSAALPFPRAAFEETIRRGGTAVPQNLKGFALGYERGLSGTMARPGPPSPRSERQAFPSSREALELLQEIRKGFPDNVRSVIELGALRMIDYQDSAYARQYLERVRTVLARDSAAHGYALTQEVARLLALRMAHEDIIRVADIKTRRRRFEEIVRDNRIDGSALWDVSEFLAPRPAELFDLLPDRLGRRLSASPGARRLLERVLSGGFTIRTSRLPGFLTLYLIARLRWLRPHSFGHLSQSRLIDEWLEAVVASAERYEFALAIADLLTLIRGYGSTLERGRRSYDQIMQKIEVLKGRADGPDRLARLIEAALADEDGEALKGALTDMSCEEKAA